jgi:hypothetical protein
MRYVGFTLSKIEGEKSEESPKGNITVNSNFNLGEVKKEGDLTKDSKQDIFSFSFVYAISYEEVAKLSFKGKVYIEIEDKSLVKDLEKSGSKFTDDELRKFILDLVLARTHVESLHLEERLNLPFHIQSPRVSFGKE